ncbi:opacity protein-like surface antigen [Bradyrhizobium japonicum]|uniref:outer membrane protein n=1 Tax=Bradyrhizobium TaxID=374 RepID=UPI0009B6E624|nr:MULTISPECIES: outer membrane beta-barrel protein [Bradyrhizobium]MBR0948572.1 outer membrane beta-barrel protein [Bradyrhizobium liaoningense]MBR1004931.1 outer membrane beta-barrel protein [Bradyrhizobium liaoningense]
MYTVPCRKQAPHSGQIRLRPINFWPAGSIAFGLSMLAAPAMTADLPINFGGTGSYNWTGYYAGVTAGGAWGQYDPTTAASEGPYFSLTDAQTVTAAGVQRIKPFGFAAGIEGGYNWQIGNLLVGWEADLQAVHLNGAATSHAGYRPSSGASSGSFTITSYGNANGLFTARPRLGFVTPYQWLVYITGGLALTQVQTDFSFIDGAAESGRRLNAVGAGYAVGAGVEVPLTDRLSVKADYLHVDFPNAVGMANVGAAGQVVTHSSGLRADLARAGLNYRFGGSDTSAGGAPIQWLEIPARNGLSDWSIETGTRVWISTGVDGEGPLFNTPPFRLASRLIYSGLDAVSGEAFARIDHRSGFFAKGHLGAGGIGNGQLNDEDFPAGYAYSNTRSDASGHIGYATIDLGYNFLRAPGAKVGALVGYNYYAQAINTYGCAQLAAAAICAPPLPSTLLGLTNNDLGLTNNDHFNSLRVGLSSEVMLSDRLRLTADAAVAPLVTYSGLDNHLLRQLLGPNASHSGTGVMFEAVLDYKFTDAWSIGVGGRYWAWQMSTGTAGFVELTDPAANAVQPQRASTERYGIFMQSSYRWGDSAVPAEGSILPTKAPRPATGPMDWSGFYVGGYLGGGLSVGRWSDPFASTDGLNGFVNVAGFGNQTRATGPLGGAQIGANWQWGTWVLGVQGELGAANMRGEDTCFSGIGGINCKHTAEAIATFTGRVGYAWGRALAYAKAGGALSRTTYDLLADTNAHRRGTGVTTLNTWDWVIGGGVEYALTNQWTTFAEYNHIGVPSTIVPFPTVGEINSKTIKMKQSVDVFKLGVNYKFCLHLDEDR